MPAAEYDSGAVYMCNFACESAYNLVCNLLPKVSRKLIFDLFLLKCVDIPLKCVDEELDPYLACMKLCMKLYAYSYTCRRPLRGAFTPATASQLQHRVAMWKVVCIMLKSIMTFETAGNALRLLVNAFRVHINAVLAHCMPCFSLLSCLLTVEPTSVQWRHLAA
jgi:hypothetical protein